MQHAWHYPVQLVENKLSHAREFYYLCTFYTSELDEDKSEACPLMLQLFVTVSIR
jgi:hypothetical protein